MRIDSFVRDEAWIHAPSRTHRFRGPFTISASSVDTNMTICEHDVDTLLDLLSVREASLEVDKTCTLYWSLVVLRVGLPDGSQE